MHEIVPNLVEAGGSWLGRWYDPALELPGGISVETLIDEERTRITLALMVVLYAGTVPRRLGGEADNDELASDKRRCRRVGHALKQACFGWDKRGVVVPEISDEIRQAGAQLEWVRFGEEHQTELNNRSRVQATWSLRNGERAHGVRAITALENERKWITYALR